MKKLYVLLSAAAVAVSASAQQLPNAGFEEGWAPLAPWTSTGNTKTEPSIGDKTPLESCAPWVISNVIGMEGLGATLVGKKAEGYNSATSVQLTNTPNPFMEAQIVPGYMSFGTSWSTASVEFSFSGITPTKTDGGAFGGLDFAYRPDAVQFMYKSNSESSTIAAYSWKGQWSQADVPGNIVMASTGSPTTATMIDRDRNILGMETPQGGAVTKSDDAELIAKYVGTIGTAAEWTKYQHDLEYLSDAAPAKFNLVFSAGDYFSTTPVKDLSLTVDDVKLIYYSRLDAITVGGVAVPGFASDTYDYDLSSVKCPDAEDIVCTLKGKGHTAQAFVSVDKAKGTAAVTVFCPSEAYADEDGEFKHVYHLQFAADAEPVTGDPKIFEGTLDINLAGSPIDTNGAKYEVHLIDNGNGTCDLRLPNFQLALVPGGDPLPLGDISVENVAMTTSGNATDYSGTKENLSLASGAIIADVKCSGTETDGKLVMTINVDWKQDGGGVIPILVVFNGTHVGTTGVIDVEISDTEAPVEYYDLNGRRLHNPERGIVIRRQGNKVSKVIL